MAIVEPFSGTPEQAQAATEEIMREYLWWCAERYAVDCGVKFDDPEAAVEAHHQTFCQELPHLLGPRGRLMVARADGGHREVVGVGGLKPVDDTTAEIKRMYVRPKARGQAIGREILVRLLADAHAIGYRNARLETAAFMTEAQALYRALGFTEIPMFTDNEAGMSGLEAFMIFMELRLDRTAPPTTGERTRLR